MPRRCGLWLTKRANRDGGYRYYFQPSRFDRDKGWKTLRLHDKNELPITKVKKFGNRRWESIGAREAKAWIREKAATHPSMAHQWYRTCRAVLNKTRLVYDQRDHPGYVPERSNSFDRLNVGLPKAKLIVWP
jgi:hypothetical protein